MKAMCRLSSYIACQYAMHLCAHARSHGAKVTIYTFYVGASDGQPLRLHEQVTAIIPFSVSTIPHPTLSNPSTLKHLPTWKTPCKIP